MSNFVSYKFSSIYIQMIFRLSLFCWGLSYNMWEKKVDSGLKSIDVRGEAIALLLMSEEKGGCAQAFKGSMG